MSWGMLVIVTPDVFLHRILVRQFDSIDQILICPKMILLFWFTSNHVIIMDCLNLYQVLF